MSSRPIRGAARLAAILDALPDALLLVNSNGTVVDANNAAVQALQAPGTSLVGMGVLDLLPEFDPSRIPGSMRPAAREDDALDRPVRMTARRTDGTTFPVEVSGNDFDDDGSAAGSGYAPPAPYDPYREGSRSSDLLLLLVRDLTGRLGVEAELRRQHKQTEMILRAAAEGVLGVDLEGRCVLVNPAAAHILEYRASELGGRELHPLIQHSRADGTPLTLEESALLDTLTSGRKHRVRGTVLWRKDGRPVTVDLTTAPVRDGDQLVGAVMTFTDRSRELALVARNEHLTAVLESELGGALTALHRRIDALAADPAGQLWPEANWTLRRLADECRRYGKLIEGVLAHQRCEAGESAGAGTDAKGADGKGTDGKDGRKAAERVPVALDKVVRRAVEHAGELVGAGRVRFSVHAAAVEVIADEQRLAQALAHLVADVSGIGLALDDAAPELPSPGLAAPGTPALPPAGGDVPAVVLAAAQRGEVARVEIRGPGRGGSPVHLPIARAVVERHGGVLQPHELPGRAGTTYVVELPLDPVAAKAAAERAAAEGRSDRPKESDSAVLPDLPGIPQLPSAAEDGEPAAEGSAPGGPAGPAAEDSPEGAPQGSADARGPEAPADPPAAGGAPGEAPAAEQRRGRRGRPAVELPPAAPEQPGRDTAAPAPAGGTAPDVPADQWPNAPARIERAVPEQWNGTGNDPAYGRQGLGGPNGPQNDPWGKDDGRSGTAYAVPVDGGRPDERRGEGNGGAAGTGEARSAGGARGPIALGPGSGDSAPEGPAGQDGGDAEHRPSRRRRALPGAEDSSGGFALPGVPETPVYPGLEHALPAGPAPAPPESAAPTPTGRRRRRAVPPGPGGET
ncbi:PAS domain-containing protein, partial [Kitasatospora sp. NPDC059462]|uniref:PAS domain-containing protein n=1 Tax=Kitasatospora sp. NPDC059462 TaxID=3346841 RepID=UPI0036B1EA5E